MEAGSTQWHSRPDTDRKCTCSSTNRVVDAWPTIALMLMSQVSVGNVGDYQNVLPLSFRGTWRTF